MEDENETKLETFKLTKWFRTYMAEITGETGKSKSEIFVTSVCAKHKKKIPKDFKFRKANK